MAEPSATDLDAAGGDHVSTCLNDSRTREGCPLGGLAVQVVRRSTDRPIRLALVRVDGLGEQRTAENGWALWEPVEPGHYDIHVRKAFYEPDPVNTSASVVAGETRIVRVELNHDVIINHLWQEWHEEAATAKYQGPTDDDRRVVENTDDDEVLQAKPNLHLCFVERAVATIEAEVLDGEVYYACWQILGPDGSVLHQHPSLSQANYDANHADARLRNGHHGWRWDGRDAASDPVFVAAGSYRSRITVKDDAGTQVHQSDVALAVQGEPYAIRVVGRPMSDDELATELALSRYGGRFLDTSGRRTARDCWILVYRGAEDDGHVVFLGKGTIEAQKTLANTDGGAVATPHGREYKGWVRHDPHGTASNYDRIQVEDVGRTDMAIALENPGGPAANNPFADSAPNTPIKDGVQAHAGRTLWVGNTTSVGCTTVSAISNQTVAAPGCVHGAVRGINPSFGGWGGAGELVSVRGPEFVNKQTKRDRTEDALIADDHGDPELDPPAHPPVGTHPDEPLHMQPTLQQGAFGGLEGHEIARRATVADDPVNQTQIRMLLEDYAAGSRYHVYHRAVVFGHSAQDADGSYHLRAWIPRKVIRGWNGNARNLLVTGHTMLSWYIVRYPPMPAAAVLYGDGLFPEGSPAGTWAALDNGDVGRMGQRTWEAGVPSPPLIDLAPLPEGDYYSVIAYRVQLVPSNAAQHAWVPEPVVDDAFPATLPAGGNRARLAAERVVTVGTQRYLEGASWLLVHQAAAADADGG